MKQQAAPAGELGKDFQRMTEAASAFSSELLTRSREENATKRDAGARSRFNSIARPSDAKSAEPAVSSILEGSFIPSHARRDEPLRRSKSRGITYTPSLNLRGPIWVAV
jgi:hypothetical protein